VVKTGQYFAG